MISKRPVLQSILTKEGWAVMLDRKPLALHQTQNECEIDAVIRAKQIHYEGGTSQVVFHKEDGEIREERTYGDDPERSPG